MTVDNKFAGPALDTDPHNEAERWFVRLQEPNCPADERAGFERWQAASPDHAAAYRAVELLWQHSQTAAANPAIMAAANRALHWTRPQPWFRRPWFFPATATAFGVAVTLAFLPRWMAPPANPPGIHYTTLVGQQRTVDLPDGSSIVLDTNTEVVERYSTHTRRMDLIHGRVQFGVHGNPKRPFVVHTPGGTVTAVGTKFQVRINDDATAVTLLEGKLAIATTPPDGKPQFAALTAGEQLTYHKTGRIGPARPFDTAAAQSWTTGKLFVRDWSLPDLLTEMNRYNENQLEIGDPSLENIRISGIFRSGDQESLIQTLEQGWSIQAKRISAQKTVLSRSK